MDANTLPVPRTADEAVSYISVPSVAENRNFLEQFKLADDDMHRMKILFSHFDVKMMFEEGVNMYVGKCSVKAEEYRRQGNEAYKLKDFAQALEFYNKCLAFAEYHTEGNKENDKPPSPEMSLAYANRSALFFHMKMYDSCILDIQRAIDAGYPSENHYKLYERKAKCYMELTQRTLFCQAMESFKFSLKKSKLAPNERSNMLRKLEKFVTLKTKNDEDDPQSEEDTKTITPTVPEISDPCPGILGVSNAVDLKISPSKGRYYASTRNINVSEVLIVENAHCAILFEEYYKTHCFHCFKRFTSPVACYQCSTVMFCSEKCCNSAWEEYHCVECRLMGLKERFQIGYIGHLALRVLLVNTRCALKIFEENKENNFGDFDNLSSDTNNGNIDNFIMEEKLASFYQLVTNSENRGIRDSVLFGIVAQIVAHALIMDFEDETKTIHRKSDLASSLYMSSVIPAMFCDSLSSLSLSQPDAEDLCNAQKLDFSNCGEEKRENTGEKLLHGDDKEEGTKKKDDLKITFAGCIMHHLQALSCNAFEITEMQLPDDALESLDIFRAKPVDIGLSISTSMSLANHSCTPTAEVIFYGKTLVLRAISKIQHGDEISVDYGPLYWIDKRDNRQAELLEKYFFECACIACVEKWPTVKYMDNLPMVLKCPNCDTPYPKAMLAKLATARTAKRLIACKVCANTDQFDEVMSNLGTSHNRYADAMGKLMSGHFTREYIKELEDHVTTINKYLCLPWKDFVQCQASLRQCYRIKGNRNFPL